MKVSLNWLKRHVDLPETVDAVSKALTSRGLEVEGIEEPGKVYSALVVGKVLECAKHPDSDHLSITKLFDGTQELQVICGAPNVAQGQTVVFAPIGAELPLPEGGSLKIKKAKIRGVESFGMICAEDEIGLGKSHDGILVLPDTMQAGTRIVDLGFYDVTLELNVTPNRPDALSHRGVARELAAAFGRELKPLSIHNKNQQGPEISSKASLQVDADCGCTHYVGRVIENVQVAPSPLWMQNLLRAVDLQPISNVVDITNFVLMDIGQPLHSFDMDLLQGSRIHVRKAREGEKITTIDHKAHTLQSSELVICDGETPACVAGVMGGAESEISDRTKRVFLESAWFDPTIVRKQAKRLGISSDSSYRFERGVDPFLQEEASQYAASLLVELSCGIVCAGKIEFTDEKHPRKPNRVDLRMSRIHRVLGVKVHADSVRKWLGGIGLSEVTACCGTPTADCEELLFEIPGFRPDLEREIDLIEEVARLMGYDNIPYDAPRFVAEINELPVQEKLNRQIRSTLAALGLHECLSLRFSSIARIRKVFGPESADRRTKPVALLNPLSEDLGVLPVSLLPGLLANVAENEKNRPTGIRLFEVAKAFFPAIDKRSDRDPGVEEQRLLAGVVAGQFDTRALPMKPRQVEFADLKGIVMVLAKRLRVPLELRVSSEVQTFLHPFRQADLVVGGRVIGFCGEVHPAVLASFDIASSTYAFEVDLDLLAEARISLIKFTMFSRQVPTTRDISLEVDERMPHADVEGRIRELGAKNLVNILLKSLYQGDKLASGRKNLLYQLVYQADDRTLTDEEVNKTHDKLRERLVQKGDIVLR